LIHRIVVWYYRAMLGEHQTPRSLTRAALRARDAQNAHDHRFFMQQKS
jgi:hypothetical protein